MKNTLGAAQLAEPNYMLVSKQEVGLEIDNQPSPAAIPSSSSICHI